MARHSGPIGFAVMVVLTAILITLSEIGGWSDGALGSAVMGAIAVGVIVMVELRVRSRSQ